MPRIGAPVPGREGVWVMPLTPEQTAELREQFQRVRDAFAAIRVAIKNADVCLQVLESHLIEKLPSEATK